jgi:hypothetical protein
MQAIIAATDAAYGAIKPFLSDSVAARTGAPTMFRVPPGALNVCQS